MTAQPNEDEVGRYEAQRKVIGNAFAGFRRHAAIEDTPEASEMRKNRAVTRRTASAGGAGSGTMQFATGRPRDPLFYWKQNNLPYDTEQDEELAKVRKYCRLLYQSHSLLASCIDIYSKYPLLGMELACKDQQIVDFYEQHFFSEDGLNYDEFLVDLGREYWTVGEAWPFATFNEPLGVWDDEELLQPDDVEVERSPFLKDPRFFIRLPKTLRDLIQKKSPAWEYAKLVEAYPELIQYAGDQDRSMPVSSILLRQLRFKADYFNKRGIPILMRAMRAVMQEEMFNAAMDAIADRLYTPLILVKLGASASDLGTQVPWIPTGDDLEDFNESFDMAMAGDFRVITHHFATEIESVFGREQMPDMTADFERVEDKMLQAFGLSRTMLTGASSGETYAADALNRDLVSQLLTDFQRLIKSHFRQRALVVAEAQGHYDYDVRDGKRYAKMEEILEIDEETGEEYIVEQPKLLIPELHMKTMNLQDEEAIREFMETLRGAGVPISIKTRIRNLSLDLEEEIEQTRNEQVRLIVAEQETRKEAYKALKNAGLPIPPDLREDFEPKAEGAEQGGAAGESVRPPMLGVDPIAMTPVLAPTQDDIMGDQPEGGAAPGGMAIAVDPSMAGGDPYADQSAVPDESHEQAEDMPKAASNVIPFNRTKRMWKGAAKIRRIARIKKGEEQAAIEAHLASLSGDDLATFNEILAAEPTGKWATPAHVGMRRYAVTAEMAKQPMDEWGA